MSATLLREPWTARLLRRMFEPVDIRFLAFFRICFAAMMLWTLWDLWDLIAPLYIAPSFHFTFHGFAWVRPWSGSGMYLHFAALALLSACVLVGFLYRVSAALLALGFTYVFLLEKAVYLNHFYLMCLLCFLLAVLPAHRAWSIDARIWPGLRSDLVPRWTLWLLRFQIGLPYVFGGIAKLQMDWLQGQPMQMWLSISPWRVLFGPVVEEHWVALAFSWGGLIFDLSIVPLLLWPRTRLAAFGAAVAFHLMNAFMFHIGIFPWLMIGATTVFLAPDWPGRLITPPVTGAKPAPAAPLAVVAPRRQKIIACLLTAYVVVHVLLPFRHVLYPGSVLWTEQGSLFSWHMMIRAKVNAVRFITLERDTGKSAPVDLQAWLTPQQIESMGHDPEMMREFAEHVGMQLQKRGQDVEVHVTALCSLNGRRPQPLIDSRVDLARQRRTLLHRPYIMPLREPFRREPWRLPIAEWEAHLAQPMAPD